MARFRRPSPAKWVASGQKRVRDPQPWRPDCIQVAGCGHRLRPDHLVSGDRWRVPDLRAVLPGLGLFTARLVALDGSKFRAVASAKRVIGRREIAEETARLDRRIADYLAGLDESDTREPDEAPSATAAALEALRTRRAELDRQALIAR
jgi:hypothetical protein